MPDDLYPIADRANWAITWLLDEPPCIERISRIAQILRALAYRRRNSDVENKSVLLAELDNLGHIWENVETRISTGPMESGVDDTQSDEFEDVSSHDSIFENLERELSMANSTIKMQEKIINASSIVINHLKLGLAKERALVAKESLAKWKTDSEAAKKVAEKWSLLARKRRAIAQQSEKIKGLRYIIFEKESYIGIMRQSVDLLQQELSRQNGELERLKLHNRIDLLKEQIVVWETDVWGADESETGEEELLIEEKLSMTSISAIVVWSIAALMIEIVMEDVLLVEFGIDGFLWCFVRAVMFTYNVAVAFLLIRFVAP